MPIDGLWRYFSEIETGNLTEWITTFAVRLPLFREITKKWYPVLTLIFNSSVNVTGIKSARRRSFNPKHRIIFVAVLSCAMYFNPLNCNFSIK